MPHFNREVLWLVALEATLSFSAPVWLPSSWNSPARDPLGFLIAVLAVAAASALVFHVAPASFAARYAPLGPWVSWILVPPAVGYTLYSTKLLLAAKAQFPTFELSKTLSIVLLLALAALAFARSWWKPVTALALLIGVSLSAYMLTTTPWELASPSDFRKDSFSYGFTEGLLIAMIPALAIGWRIGCLESRGKHIWLTAFLGLFLPLVLSSSIAGLMTEAGVHRYWSPSLTQDLTYALLGPNGGHNATALHVIVVLVGLSILGPAFVGALSIRFLSAGFNIAKKLTLAICAGAIVFWLLLTQPYLTFYPLYDLPLERLAMFMALLGVVAGLFRLFHRPGAQNRN